MKKLLVTFLGIAFLLPALASAGSYCVIPPDDDGGNSLMSITALPGDGNLMSVTALPNVGIQFRYDYSVPIGIRPTSTHSRLTPDPKFFASSGTTDGSSGTNHIAEDYTYYPLGPHELCVYDPAPDFGRVSYVDAQGTSAMWEVKIYELRADVKYGRDCPTVAIRNNLIVGNHRFEIYRRSGNHTNTWGCRRKKKS